MPTSAWPRETARLYKKLASLAPRGLFSTGIENSDPYVEGKRRNELVEAYDFTKNYRKRLENIKKLGIEWVRFGVGYSQVSVGPNNYDFSLSDKVFEACEELGLTVIADLLHFGLPEWLHKDNPGNPFFQNEKFPQEFARYGRAFARRYPQIKYFTPVNEPLVTAVFSAKNAMWNESVKGNSWNDDKLFVRAIANVARAAILAKLEIRKVWKEEKREGEPLFFQNDSFEKCIAALQERQAEADRFNLARFSALDLILGYRNSQMKKLLTSQGLKDEEYEWFMKNGDTQQTILGIDHYPLCIHFLNKNGHITRARGFYDASEVNEVPNVEASQKDTSLDGDFYYGLREVVEEYWSRYKMPLLHMEVNGDKNALLVCQETYKILERLKKEGLPILGMAWFGDEVQIGWGHGLMGPHAFDEHVVGLYYKGEKQPVADLFSQYASRGI